MTTPGSEAHSSSKWFLAAAVLATTFSFADEAPLMAVTVDELPAYSIPGGRLFDHAVAYKDDDDHFRYGSLGGERGYHGQIGFGLPYWIWVALPEVFPDLLPDKKAGQGYAGFGYTYEPGGDPRFQLPAGTSQRNNLTIDRVWINCGACHTGTYRDTPQGERHIVSGMPANRYNQGAWAKFLFDSAADPRFDGAQMVRKIRELEKERRKVIATGKLAGPKLPKELSPFDELIYKSFVIPIMRRRLLVLRERLGFIDLTTWGPGRVDTWNAPKALLNFPMDKAPAKEKLGNVDLPSVWHQRPRFGMHLHWDGNNTEVQERNLSAAFAGVIPPTLDKCSLRRMARYLETLAPPPFPSHKIDRALAARGEPIYNYYCSTCHGAPAPPFKREGKVERSSAPSFRSTKSGPTAGTTTPTLPSWSGPRTACTPSIRCRIPRPARTIPAPRITPPASATTARPAATPAVRWTASGCEPRISTTARCPICGSCSSRAPTGPRSSGSGTTSTTTTT